MSSNPMIGNEKKNEHRKYEHLDDAPVPITICKGEHMTIQYANQRALSLFVSANSEFPGKAISEIFPDAFPEEVITQICQDCFSDEKSTQTKHRRFLQPGKDN